MTVPIPVSHPNAAHYVSFKCLRTTKYLISVSHPNAAQYVSFECLSATKSLISASCPWVGNTAHSYFGTRHNGRLCSLHNTFKVGTRRTAVVGNNAYYTHREFYATRSKPDIPHFHARTLQWRSHYTRAASNLYESWSCWYIIHVLEP